MLPDLTDQFIADSYAGILHTSEIPATGTNLPQVYDGLGNKTSFSIGSDGNGGSFTGTLSSGNYSIGNYATLIDYLYPIGSVYFSVGNTNPATRFAGTGWTQISEGRFIVGVGSDQDDNSVTKTFTEGENNGEYQHTLTVAEMPSHGHNVLGRNERFGRTNSSSKTSVGTDPTRIKGITDNTGGNLPHNNTPPGFGLYVWERTS
jgi:hypothetical protein